MLIISYSLTKHRLLTTFEYSFSSLTMDALLEAHIAIPQIKPALAEMVITDLRDVGITRYKYFVRLLNVPISNQPCQIDPETHDVDNPMIITRTRMSDPMKMKDLILRGMAVLDKHRIHGANFELELDTNTSPSSPLTINDFPSYSQQEGAPKFEYHMSWKGPRKTLPSDVEIEKYHRNIYGHPPNQIADLSLSQYPLEDDAISRVATVYHETRDQVLAFTKKAQQNMRAFPGAHEVIAEQICVVSEPNRSENTY